MPIDKQKLKESLEKERNSITEQLKDIGQRDPKTGEWDATPESQSAPEADPNEMADRFEDFESRSSMIDVLEGRLQKIEEALAKISKSSYGVCRVCKKDIELARLEANPAADTCKKHLEE